MKILKIAAVIIALAGVAVFARFLMRPDDKAIVKRAQRLLVDASSLRHEEEIQLVGDLKGFEGLIRGQLRTDVDFSDPDGAVSASTFDFKVTGDKKEERRLSGESRKTGGFHYLKLEEGSVLAESEAVAKLVGKWSKSLDPLYRLLFPRAKDAAVTVPPTAAGLLEMREAAKNVDIFNEITALPDETFEGAKVRRYFVSVDQDAVIALLLKWRELTTRTPTDDDDFIVATAEAAAWGFPQGELWIDKKTGYPRRMILKSVLASSIGAAEIGVDAVFSRYGEAVKVEAPEPAEDLASFLEAVLEGRLRLAGDRELAAKAAEEKPVEEKKAPPPAPPAEKVDGDVDGLDDSQENFYGTDVWNPDSDGDGFTDGQEVKNGMNPAGPGALFSFGLGN